jgi:hypothetical protein
METKVAFLDHYYHAKTKSGDFLREILNSNFQIDNYWINNDLKLDERIFSYEKLFFFQILPNFEDLKKIKNKNIVWAPMYDSPHYPFGYSWILWKIIKYFDIKVISFSKKITDQLKNKKINYISLKFHKRTVSQKINNKINIFFWNRGDIRISEWINSININEINKIYYLNLDKIYPEIIDKSLRKKFFVIKKNFLDHASFLRLLKKCEIFVSPRKKEGIGMAQVEALSMGKYLLGFRDATMEDYILNKKIGIFFDKNNFDILDINDVLNFKKYRLSFNEKGYKRYTKKKEKILNLYYIKKNKFKRNFFFELLVFIFYFYKTLIRRCVIIPFDFIIKKVFK